MTDPEARKLLALAMMDAALEAHSAGDPAPVQAAQQELHALAALAQLPNLGARMAQRLDEGGAPWEAGEESDWVEVGLALDFAESDWRREPGPRSDRRWVHVRTGRVVYQNTNPGAPRGRGQRNQGTQPAAPAAATRPATPAPTAARRQSAGSVQDALGRITGGPDSTPADLHTLLEGLPSLTVAQLRQARQQLQASFGGAKTKEPMVAALRGHVQGMLDRQAPPATKDDTSQGRAPRVLDAATLRNISNRQGLGQGDTDPRDLYNRDSAGYDRAFGGRLSQLAHHAARREPIDAPLYIETLRFYQQAHDAGGPDYHFAGSKANLERAGDVLRSAWEQMDSQEQRSVRESFQRLGQGAGALTEVIGVTRREPTKPAPEQSAAPSSLLADPESWAQQMKARIPAGSSLLPSDIDEAMEAAQEGDHERAAYLGRRIEDALGPAPAPAPTPPTPPAWRPSMSASHADAWAQSGALPRPLFHTVGNAAAIESIGQQGFDLAHPSGGMGRHWGDGVYFSVSREEADQYDENVFNGSGKTAEFRARPQKVYIFDAQGKDAADLAASLPGGKARFSKLADRYGNEYRRLLDQAREEGAENPHAVAIQRSGGKYDSKSAALTDMLREAGYDALYVRGGDYGDEVVIFDPKQITMVDASAPAPVTTPSRARQPGDVWQGASGRWFTMRPDRQVVQTTAPGSEQRSGRGRSRAQQPEPVAQQASRTIDPQAIINAMHDEEPQLSSGAHVLLRDVRKRMGSGISKQDFDRAIIDMAERGQIVLNRHDQPSFLTPGERQQLVQDEDGTYYVSAGFRAGQVLPREDSVTPDDVGIDLSPTPDDVGLPTDPEELERSLQAGRDEEAPKPNEGAAPATRVQPAERLRHLYETALDPFNRDEAHRVQSVEAALAGLTLPEIKQAAKDSGLMTRPFSSRKDYIRELARVIEGRIGSFDRSSASAMMGVPDAPDPADSTDAKPVQPDFASLATAQERHDANLAYENALKEWATRVAVAKEMRVLKRSATDRYGRTWQRGKLVGRQQSTDGGTPA